MLQLNDVHSLTVSLMPGLPRPPPPQPPRRSAGGNLGISHLTEMGLPLSSRLPFLHASFNLTLSQMGWMEIVSSSLWLQRRTERINTSILRTTTIAGIASRLFGSCEVCKIWSYFFNCTSFQQQFPRQNMCCGILILKRNKMKIVWAINNNSELVNLVCLDFSMYYFQIIISTSHPSWWRPS